MLQIIEEIWKPIINYEGLYEISNYGQIKRFYKDRRSQPFIILKSQISRKHLQVSLCKNGIVKQYYVHTLVLETFVGPRPLGMQCRHLDGNSINNRLSNLKWGTQKENSQDMILHGTSTKGSKNPSAKLNDYKIIEIRKLHLEGKSDKEIAKRYDISKRAINFIVNNKTWKHVREK